MHVTIRLALIVLVAGLSGCALAPCFIHGGKGCPIEEPVPAPTPTPDPGPHSDCRQVPGPEACAPGQRCVLDGTWRCVPSPVPTPTPTPTPAPTPTPTPTPTPAPTPTPTPGACPFGAESLLRVGVALHHIRPTSGAAIKDGYLGKVYALNATPKSRPPFCPHRPTARECEQLICAQDPRGASIYMTLPGKWTDERCNPASNNPWLCRHKPKRDETGPTTFTACPSGVRPPDARCSSTVVPVG